jgi:hypothetical protein
MSLDPSSIEPTPVIAYKAEPAAHPKTMAAMAAENAALHTSNAVLVREIESLRIKLAEREKIAPPPTYLPLKLAANLAGVQYDRARVWHSKKLIDSRKDAGRIVATVASLIERRVLLNGK